MTHQAACSILAATLLLTSGVHAQCGGNGGLSGLASTPQAAGTTVTYTVTSAPGADFGLFMSDQRAQLAVPGVGTVCLDVFSPGFLELVDATMPAAGSFDVTLSVPSDPAFLAFVAYLQAVAADPGHPSGIALSRAMRVDFETPDGFIPQPALLQPTALASGNALPDGRAFLAGGGSGSLLAPAGSNQTQLYDPLDRVVTAGPALAVPRSLHTGTTLADGRVLLAGGVMDASGTVTATCEIFDPATDSFTAAATMGTPRAAHTATLLQDGRVLVAGGTSTFSSSTGQIGPVLNSALTTGEVYDPQADTWTPVSNSMQDKRFAAAAALLQDGRVLVASGINGAASIFGTEIPTWTGTCDFFDPQSGQFQPAPGVGGGNAVAGASAAVHPGTGDFLLIGGAESQLGVPTATSRILLFDGSSWSSGPNLPVAVVLPGVTVQQDGKVHISGGATGTLLAPGATASCRAWDGTSLLPKASLPQPRGVHAAVTLRDGNILVAGGADQAGSAVDTTHLYTPDP